MSAVRRQVTNEASLAASGPLLPAATSSAPDTFLRELAETGSHIPMEPDRIGHTVGRYRIEAELGRGGMGVVYLGFDETLGRHVALKVMRAAFAAGRRGAHAGLLREARCAAAIQHAHVATIYELGEHQGLPFIALEYVKGRSLRSCLREHGPVTDALALRMAQAMASALAHAHSAGVIHRDLKPENVLVTDALDVKLVDFGLAHLLPEGGGTSGGSRSRFIVGTQGYMSPEQARGEPAQKTCDVFAFGVVLHELLNGKRPELVDEPRSGVFSRSNLTLRDVIRRCLEVDPAARPRDGAELTSLLAQVVVEPKRRMPLGQIRLMWVVAALLTALIGGLWMGRDELGPAAPKAKARTTRPMLPLKAESAPPLPVEVSPMPLPPPTREPEVQRPRAKRMATRLRAPAVGDDPSTVLESPLPTARGSESVSKAKAGDWKRIQL